jgi:hypothetical protein
MAYTVFVSYAAEDRPYVDAIRAAARPLGIAVYSYDQDLKPGENLPAKLVSNIASSDAVVAILTARGAASQAVNQEIGAARSAGKPIIPLFEKGVDPAKFTLLQGIEHDILDRDDFNRTLIRLIGRLGAMKHRSDRNGWIVLAGLGGLLLWASRGEPVEDQDDEYEYEEFEEWEEYEDDE